MPETEGDAVAVGDSKLCPIVAVYDACGKVNVTLVFWGSEAAM